jgi:hypothetical protein
MIDRPGAELRALGVLAWGRGVRAVRLTGLASWRDAVDMLSWSDTMPGRGRWYGNGAGFLFWPGGAAESGAPRPPLGSLRLELLRLAAGDWRCYELLARVVEEGVASGLPAEDLAAAQACLSWARGLVAVPPAEERARQRTAALAAIAQIARRLEDARKE